jgi:flavodoxin
MKSLLVLYSYHHKNTEKVAQVMAEVLNSQIKTPKEIKLEELNDFNLIGFVSRI